MPSRSDPHPVVCSPYVARLESPSERLEALREKILEETDPLVTVTHLLHLCRDEHRVLWEQAGDPQLRAMVGSVLGPARSLVASHSADAELAAPVRRALAAALGPVDGLAPVMIAHAAAQLLDEHYDRALTSSFRRRILTNQRWVTRSRWESLIFAR